MANHNHKRASYRHAATLLAVLLAVYLTAGCQGPLHRDTSNPLALAPPVPPTSQQHPASGLMTESSQFSASLSRPCGIQDMVLSYLNTGRHFEAPDPNADPIETAEPQGYVLRVIPLDEAYRVICPTGTTMRISLYRAHTDTSVRALMNWVIEPEQLNAYWTRTQLLDGFLVRLSWGANDPGCGDYVLSVTLDCSTPKQNQFQRKTIYFSDILRRP